MASSSSGAGSGLRKTPGSSPLGVGFAWGLSLCLGSCGEAATAIAEAPEVRGFAPVRPAEPEALGPHLARLIEEHVERVEQAPADAEAHGVMGLVFEANRMWPEALASLEQAALLDPGDPVWPGHRAKMLQRMGRAPAALEVLTAAAAQFRRSAPLQHQYGDALFEAGELERARQAFERTTRLARKRGEGFVGLGEVQLALGEGPAAVETLERAIRKSPQDKRAHYLLGLAYREVGRLPEAELELLRGLDGRKSFLPDRGARQLAGLVRGFERLLERGIRLTDTAPRDALVVLGECRELQPSNPIVLVNLGVALQRLERPAEALEVLLEADRLNPDVPMVQVNLSACLLVLERPQEALRAAEHAVELAPGLARAHTLHARSLLALGRASDAHGPLLLSSELDPDDPSVQEQLGELCLELGHGAEAVEHYTRLCELLHQSWEAHAQLVRAAVLADDISSAREALHRALALAPDEPQLVAMADALAALGPGDE